MAPEIKEERCRYYLGATCVDGSCPIDLQKEHPGYGYDEVNSCTECPYYEGCVDCAFAGTDMCAKVEGV